MVTHGEEGQKYHQIFFQFWPMPQINILINQRVRNSVKPEHDDDGDGVTFAAQR